MRHANCVKFSDVLKTYENILRRFVAHNHISAKMSFFFLIFAICPNFQNYETQSDSLNYNNTVAKHAFNTMKLNQAT
jgi:hypothetical protein